MKKKSMFVFLAIFFFFSCGNSGGTQTIIVGLSSSGIGVVVGNELRFYDAGRSGGWTEDEDYRFALPNNFRNVIGLSSSGIGVVVGNELRFYDAGHSGGWTEDEDYIFILP